MITQIFKFIFSAPFRAVILGTQAVLINFIIKTVVFSAFIFFLIKYIKNIKRKVEDKMNDTRSNVNSRVSGARSRVSDARSRISGANSKYNPLQEGLENINDGDDEDNINVSKSVPEPANINTVSQYTGVARRSGEYNNKIFNKLEDQTNRLLMKDYGENYIEILDRFDYLLSLKMLDNTLSVDFDNEKQMLSKIEKINKYGDAKKFIEEMKDIVSLEMPNNGM